MEPSATRDSADLVRRAVEGDREAFAVLVKLHQPEIYRFFRRCCRTEEDARDQCQLTFVRAFGNIRKFEGRSSFRTWLFRIATNLSKNYYRDRGRRPEVPLTAVDDDDSGPGRERDVPDDKQVDTLRRMETLQMRSALRQAVETLPPRQQAVVVLRIYHEMSFAEIADAESITANNAKVSFCHAVKNLKKVMATAEVGR